MKLKYLFLFLSTVFITACKKSDKSNPEPTSTEAKFAVAKILQSNMVIQRDKPFKIWGTATTATKVDVKVTWNSSAFIATANAAGKWEVTIPAAPANANPQTITATTVNDKPIQLENMLIGDVWLCAGQSNMVMQMANIPPFQGVENFETEIAAANYPQIRYYMVTGDAQSKPLYEFSTQPEWKICSPGTAGNMSAVAYYFSRKLHTDLKVPVGVIVSAVNGSWCDSWMNAEAFSTDIGVTAYTSASRNSTLYNGMISPFINLSIKGFLWYQGENDQKLSPVSIYTRLNTALIRGWRSAFKQGGLPFYLVQLTPFNGGVDDASANWLAYFREAQAQVRDVSGTGMAVTMDAGEVANHHPKYKKPVGERLALLALKNTYGQNVQAVGPRYQSFTQAGNQVTINLVPGTANGLNTIDGKALNQHFFVAGSNRIFRQATAQINGDKIILTVPATVTLPVVAVRYAFTNFPITNLQNASGLPMEPFRTDDWDN